jgi:hypothetical protein
VILTLAILILLLLGAAAFVAMPLLGGRKTARRDEERRATLMEREMAFQLLRDIQHDHLTGKIDDEDFMAQKAANESRAMAAMQRFDALGGVESGDALEILIRQERARLQRETR